MLKLIGINVDKWVEYLIIAAVVLALLVGGYLYWKHNVTAQAQLAFNNAQLEQTVKDQNEEIARIKAINQASEQAIVNLNKQKDELNSKLRELDDFLNSEEATKADRESSSVLKKTIEKLRKL